MAEKLVYLVTPGTIDTLFKRIKEAAVPERFDGEFINTTLGIKGGTGNACVPFLKRIGFLKGDGAPTENYRYFRNNNLSGSIIAQAIKQAYSSIFQVNENANTLSDDALKTTMVQVSGLPNDSRQVELAVSTFKYLKKYANFESKMDIGKKKVEATDNKKDEVEIKQEETPSSSVNLSYTFYLNLPNTTDIAVFNAIFKALK